MIFLQEDVEVLINKKALRTDLFIQDYKFVRGFGINQSCTISTELKLSMIHNFFQLHFYYDTAHA